NLSGRLKRAVGGRQRALHQSDSTFGTGGSILGQLIYRVINLTLSLGDLLFGKLAQAGLQTCNDVIDMLAVGRDLLRAGLNQIRSEVDGFLDVTHFKSFLSLLHCFVERGTCNFEVQVDQLLETIEYRFLECEEVIDRGSLVGEKMLGVRAHK